MKRSSNPAEALARLKELSRFAGRNTFERTEIAVGLIDDKKWVQSSFGGDAYKAVEWLEADYFHDVCHARSLWDLMRVYRSFPKASEWQQRDWNVSLLLAACKDKSEHESIPRLGRRVKLREHEAALAKIKDLEFQARRLDKEAKTKDEIIADLERQVAKLGRENLKLQGRIEELENLLDRRMARRVG